MNKNRIKEHSEKIFGYNPTPLKEEFNCVFGPILALIGLEKIMPNVSESLSEAQIKAQIRKNSLDTSVEEIINSKPFHIGGTTMRAVVKTAPGKYVVGSYFYD